MGKGTGEDKNMEGDPFWVTAQKEEQTQNQTDIALVNPRHKLSLQEFWRLWYAEGNYGNSKSQAQPSPWH